jgi:uncharacterized membrane protein YfcA
MIEWLFFALIAFLGSVVSSMMALGAVLITTPLLDLVASDDIDFHQIGFLNLVLVLVSAIVAAAVHQRAGNIDLGFVRRLVPVTALGALSGGIVAQWVPEFGLRVIFVTIALLSLVLGLLPIRSRLARLLRRGVRLDTDSTGMGVAPIWPLLIVFGVITFASGLVGVGGGLLLTPLLLKVVRLEPKTAIGSMMLIGLTTTISALIGRIGAPLPPWQGIVAVAIGAAVGGLVGSFITTRMPARVVAPLISIVVVLSAGQTLAAQLLS